MQQGFWTSFFFGIILMPVWGQEPDDGLGNYADAFQDCFFEALKQSNIENHQRAVVLFNQCKELNSKEPALYYELGKNYLSIKNFPQAEIHFLKAQELDSQNIWYKEALFDFYQQTGQTEKSIEIAEKLLGMGRNYHETLINLYLENRALEKAQKLLVQLKERVGQTPTVDSLEEGIDALARSLNRQHGWQLEAANADDYRNNLKDLLKENNLNAYAALSDRWLQASPGLESQAYALVHFIQQNDSAEIKKSFNALLSTTPIDPEMRQNLMGLALDYAIKNQIALGETAQLTEWVKTHPTTAANNTRLMNYFLINNENQAALSMVEKLLQNDATSFQALSVKVQILNRNREFAQAQDLAEQALGLYPAQPIFYLESGKAMLGLNRPDSSVETLLSGLDLIFDNTGLQNAFYEQLASAYKLIGNSEREQFYRSKIINIP